MLLFQPGLFGATVSLLVHNAGLVAPTSFETFEPDAAHSIFDVNTFAAHALLAAALPHLQAGAAMVNISSVNATLPPKGASLYGASKAALELLVPEAINANQTAQTFDVIILDLMLPNVNGLDICRLLRRQNNLVPILMLSAKGTETDRVVGLEVGADDSAT